MQAAEALADATGFEERDHLVTPAALRFSSCE
jgi:hypothetical protein